MAAGRQPASSSNQSRSQTRSRSRSPRHRAISPSRRSRSRSPSTPPTPSNAFQWSGEEDELIMPFDCNVIMSSGRFLKSFKCNELTSIGYIRNNVLQILRQMQNKGELQEFDSFQLLRGEQICVSDYTRVYEVFANLENEECVLTVVVLQPLERCCYRAHPVQRQSDYRR